VRLIGAGLVAATLLGACAAAPSTLAARAASDDTLDAQLAAGDAQLRLLTAWSGYSEVSSESSQHRDLLAMYETRAWRSLALAVMRVGSGSDLAWHYLGRSAEGLGYPAAARTYYRKSIEAAARPGVSGCILMLCSGFHFPEDSINRLKIVEQTLAPPAPTPETLP
jgi:hypothetical protein